MNTLSPVYHQKGLTIIELMVSILVGAMVLAGVVQLYANSSTNAITYEGAARIQENALFAFNRIEQDVIQSGSNGCFGLAQAQEGGRSRIVNALSITTDRYDMTNFIGGYENTGTNNTDRLFVRFADKASRIPINKIQAYSDQMVLDDADSDYMNLEQYQVIYIANCTRMAAVMITNAPSAGGVVEFKVGVASPAGALNEGVENTNVVTEDVNIVADINDLSEESSLGYVFGGSNAIEYSVDTSAAATGVCEAANPQNCALFRNGLEIIEGVHDFQVEYGWEDTSDNVVYGTWTDVVTASAQLAVDRVKTTLSFNSIQRTPTLDGDDYLSKTMSRIFMIRNNLPAD